MLKGHTFEIDGNRARFPGLDFGYGDSEPFILGRTEHYMVLYRRPVRDWLSRGETSGFPAEYYLIEYSPHPEMENTYLTLRVVANETPGHRWKRARALLLERMNELEAERTKTRPNGISDRGGARSRDTRNPERK